MDIIGFVENHQGFFTVLFSLILVVVTTALAVATSKQAAASVTYAKLTEQLVEENALIRKAQTDPLLSVSLVAHEFAFGFVDLQIKNEGGGAARNVRFKIEPEPDADEDLVRILKSFGFVEAGISYLGPRQEIRTFFASCAEKGDKRMKTRIGMVALYNTPRGETRTERYVLDFYSYRNYSALGTPPLVALKEAIEKLGSNLAQIADVVTRPRV